MSTINYEQSLNSEQLAAVTAGDGPLLALAAAGTGKTRTLVYRVARLVETGVPPERILLLTFTNKASQEMLARTAELVGREVGGMWGGTFHHMANKMLRRHASLIGYTSSYTILDRDDSRRLIRDSMKDRKVQSTDFPKPDVLLSILGSATNREASIHETAEAYFSEHLVDIDNVVSVIHDYKDRKLELVAMDFDDLLSNCLKLLIDEPDVLAHYQQKFLHVLVDEYQDTNTIQAQLVDKLAAGHGNLLVVGDDFQAIYSWRGASFENIMSFPDRYPGTQVFKLETNYRSTPNILELANACIAGNPDQFQKRLRPTREAHEKPVLARLRDGDHQARYVVEQILRLEREGYKRSQIAILYRAHYHAMELQMLLTRERVPYVITSGARFFEQAHIKDACSVIRILQNPGDEVAFVRLIQLLPRVGRQTAAKLWRKLGKNFQTCDPTARQTLIDALPGVAREQWTPVSPILAAYHDEELKNDAGEVLNRFIELFYADYAVNTFDDHRRRIDDIRELILFTSKFESVEEFLSEMALLSNLDAEAAHPDLIANDNSGGGNPAKAIRLSTVHQAKGLEWGAVIILWMTDGMFPSARTLAESMDDDSEERRLFYVAATRARDELILCVPQVRRMQDGGVQYCTPSRFVSELPPNLLRSAHVRY